MPSYLSQLFFGAFQSLRRMSVVARKRVSPLAKHLHRWLITALRHGFIFYKRSQRKFKKLPRKYQLLSLAGIIVVLLGGTVGVYRYQTKRSLRQTPHFSRNLISSWTYEGLAPDSQITTRLGKNSTGARIQVSREKSRIEFSVPLAQAQLIQQDESLVYQAPAAEYSLKYEMTPQGLKESILLDQPVTINTFTSEFSTTNLTAKLTPENIPVFFDTDNQYQFHFERPFAQDASGNTTYAVKYLLVPKGDGDKPLTNPNDLRDDLYQTSQNKLITKELLTPIKELPINTNNYELVIEVDPAWLFAAERTYPIMIDPTVVHDESTEFASGAFNRTKDYGSGSSPSVENTYQRLAVDKYTVGLWHMDESADNTCAGGQDLCDSSGNGLHAVFNGNAAFTNDARVGSRAMTLDGNGDFAQIPDSSLFDFGTGDYTIEFWAKADAFTSSNTYIELGSSGNSIIIRQNDPNTLAIYSMSALVHSVLYTPPINEWYHVAIVRQANVLQVYINGNPYGASIINTSNINVSGVNRFGSSVHTTGQYLDGIMDEIRISNAARTQEEIKMSAARTPSGIYTSDTIDLGTTGVYDSLTWTTLGESPEDAETPADNTDLIAQWKFNETSGTTAANDAGSCGTTCNGTLTGFASTASQDAAIGSGWTSLNRRWGAGALTFDGSDIVLAGTNSVGTQLQGKSGITIAGWAKLDALPASGARARIFNTNINGESGGASLAFYHTDAQIELTGRSQSGDSLQIMLLPSPANPLEWHYYVGVLDYANDQMRFYIDGKLVKSQAASFGSSTYSKGSTTYQDSIGGKHQVSGYADYLNGTIDALSIYGRVLSESEIQANYAVSGIEVQTRSSADGSSWGPWSTEGNETSINNMDTPYSPNLPGLVGYFAMDELNNDSCLGTKDVCDSSVNRYFQGGNITGTPAIVDGKIGKARDFNATGQVIVFDSYESAAIHDLPALTLSAWIKPRSAGEANFGRIIDKNHSSNSAGWQMYMNVNNRIYFDAFFTGGYLYRYSSESVTLNEWNHVAVTWDGSNLGSGVKIYINGQETNYGFTQDTTGTRGSDAGRYLRLGNTSSGRTFDGLIDETMIFNRVLSADEIAALAAGPENTWKTTNPTTLGIEAESEIKYENLASTEVSARSYTKDQNTVGLWKFEETGGSGAYLKDSSGNENHLSVVGSSLTSGMVGNGRDLNGSSDYLEATSITIPTTDFTYEAWIKPDTTNDEMLFMAADSSGGNEFFVHLTSTNKVQVATNGTVRLTTTFSIQPSVWQHLAVRRIGSTIRVFINGTLDSAVGTDGGVLNFDSCGLLIGTDSDSGCSGSLGNWFDGSVDEIRVSNIGRTHDEIVEAFRLGRDHYANLTIETSDLSNEEGLPFYVAADQPGTYLTGTIGETPHANYQADAGTVGLWHFDDELRSGVSIKDSSGNGLNGTASNVGGINGKVGRSMLFGGVSSSNINLGNPTALRMTGTQTIEMWLYPTSFAVRRNPFNKAYAGEGTITQETNGTLNYYYGTGGGDTSPYSALNSVKPLTLNKWNHVAIVRDLQNMQWHWYINGVKTATGTAPYAAAATSGNSVIIGHGYAGSYLGSIDEVRISNVARTAEEIRQAYEVGSRTLPITIDFAATLDSSNLISNSSDFSFTIDATTKGLPQKGSHLHVGETIIIKENYNGTEYVAQGVVTSVTESSGAVTVSSWNAGSTFPAGGFTANASVFKWQTEFWRTKNSTLTDSLSATSLLSLKFTDSTLGRTVWLDDLKSTTGYLTNGGAPTSDANRYFQYRALLNSTDPAISASFTSASLSYSTIFTTLEEGYLHDKIKSKTATPTIRFSASDSSNADLDYQVQWASDPTFTAPTSASSDTDAGFVNVTNGGDTTPFTNGNIISYTWQTPLTNGVTYYYRVRAKIFGGGYGSWSDVRSMTIDTALSNNGWYETHAVQFDKGTKDTDILVSAAGNYVYMQQPTETTAYTMPITVSNSGSELTNHHTLLTVDTATLISANKLQSDCDDLRFFDQNEVQLTYWIESDCNSSSTRIWVEIPSLPNGDTTINMNYGNPSATRGSEDYTGKMMAGFDSTCPAGWTAVSTLNSNNYYIRGGTGTVGTIGGSATHAHSVTLTTGGPSATDSAPAQSSDNDNMTHPNHTHTWSGNTAAANNNPSYYDLVFCNYSGTEASPATLSTNLVGMFTSTPAGWTRLSAMDNRFPRANTTAGGTGGVASHTHTISGTFPATTTKLGDNGNNDKQVSRNSHTHTFSMTTGSSSSLPAYSTVIFAKPNSATTITDDQIAMFNSNTEPPLGWTRYTALNNRMPFGSATAGTNGGSDTVTHTTPAVVTGNDTTSVSVNSGGNPTTAAETSHNHTTVPTTTAAGNIVPPYYTVSFYQRQVDPTTKSFGAEAAASSSQTYMSTPITASQITTSNWSKVLINDVVTNGSVKYHIYYDNNGTPTPIPSGDLPGNANGFSSSPISLTSISTSEYPVIYLVAEFIYDSGSPELHDWEVVFNTPPNVPTLDEPADAAFVPTLTPTLKTTATDPESDSLQYKIELCTDLAMTENCQTFDQTTSQTGWSGQNAASGTRYNSGTQGSYTLQTPLAIDSTYYWRSYAIDPSGSNQFGDTQATPYSFKTDHTPTMPTALEAEGTTDPIEVTDATPEFSAIFNDPDPAETAVYYQIQVNDESDFSGNIIWDSEKSALTPVTSGNRSQLIEYAGTQLTIDGLTYYWRIRFWDDGGLVSPYSEVASFQMDSSNDPTPCYAEKDPNNTYINIFWKNVVGEDSYTIERSINGGSFTTLTSKAANTSSHQDGTVALNTTYQYRIRSTAGAENSAWCTTTSLRTTTGGTHLEGINLEGVKFD